MRFSLFTQAILVRLRHVVYGATICVAIIAAAAAVFAIAIPFYLDRPAVRTAIIDKLAAVTGGSVTFQGPLVMSHRVPFALSVSGITITSTSSSAPFRKIKAHAVVARLDWSRLLLGQIALDRVTFRSPRLVMARNLKQIPFFDSPLFNMKSIKALTLPLALPNGVTFPQMIFKNATILISPGPTHAYHALSFNKIRLSQSSRGTVLVRADRPTGATMSASIKPGAPGNTATSFSVILNRSTLTASFSGEHDHQTGVIAGQLSMTAGSADPFVRAVRPIALTPSTGGDTRLTADVAISSERLVLDEIDVTIAGRTSRGSLTVSKPQDRVHVEGTIAYDTVDVSEFLPGAGFDGGAVNLESLLVKVRPKLENLPIDLDLRLSADRIVAPNLVAGPVGLAMIAHRDKLSLDIAELSVFGGTLQGRIDFEGGAVPSVTIKASARKVEASAAAAMFMIRPNFVNALADIQLDMTVRAPDFTQVQTTSGTFSISLPSGESVSGDAVGLLRDALIQGGAMKNANELQEISSLTVEGSIGNGEIAAKVQADSGATAISGFFHVAPFNNALVGRLKFSDNIKAVGRLSPPALVSMDHDATVGIAGSLSSPVFSMIRVPQLSN